MPEPGRPGVAGGSGSTRRWLPELTEVVAPADIPVLQPAMAVPETDSDMPTLTETFAGFEKTIPVLYGDPTTLY